MAPLSVELYPTPTIGSLYLAARKGHLVAIGFVDDESRPEASLPAGLQKAERVEDPAALAPIRNWLDRYFRGEAPTIDSLGMPCAPEGTDFDHKVWDALRDIPYGDTWSYGQLAETIGSPRAARAVGHANGRNPLPVLVPCHRVVGSNGKLTGFGGGLDRKLCLLELESPLFVTS